MAMGTRRRRQRQEELWYRGDLVEAPGHPFYRRLNEVLDQAGFDEFCETRGRKFYHEKLGRPSLAPGGTSETGSAFSGGQLPPDAASPPVRKRAEVGQLRPGLDTDC